MQTVAVAALVMCLTLSSLAAPTQKPTDPLPLEHELNSFLRQDWPSGPAPRLRIGELRDRLAALEATARLWIEAAPLEEQARYRIAAATYVLDLLYTQNDPYIWTDRQPAPDLLYWASDLLGEGPRSREEQLWFLGAVGLVERAGAGDTLERICARALRRFPGEGRFLVGRGVAVDLATWPEERDVHNFDVAPATVARLTSRYEDATKVRASAAEAWLRLGYFELRRGKVQTALDRFAAAGLALKEQGRDPVLIYWHRLLRGRALEAADRLPEAVEAYRTALTEVPNATSATSALVAALTKAGRIPEASRIAEQALTRPAATLDPWTLYVLPDFRYWPTVMTSLREAVVQ